MSLKNQNWKSTTQDKMQIGKKKKKKKKKNGSQIPALNIATRRFRTPKRTKKISLLLYHIRPYRNLMLDDPQFDKILLRIILKTDQTKKTVMLNVIISNVDCQNAGNNV